MCFRKSTDGKIVTAEVYPYHGTENARKLIYELKRRLYLVLEAKIYEQYNTAKEEEEIYSKAETAHRFVFDRHRHFPTFKDSVAKGREIMD